MSPSRTKIVDLRKLLNSGDSGITIILLMMAVNDIVLTNQSDKTWDEEKNPMNKALRAGARMYFVRLQFAHLHEAKKIITKIKKDRHLKARIDRFPLQKEAFSKLTNLLKGESIEGKYSKKIRDKTTFHYDSELVKEALVYRAKKKEGRLSEISETYDLSTTRLKVPDDIIDTLICRQICEISEDTELSEAINEIMGDLSSICHAFVQFGLEFSRSYIKEHALATG